MWHSYTESLPLAPNTRRIRVLDLDPLSARPGAEANSYTDEQGRLRQLTGRLRVVDLNDLPAFAILSYVWGKKAVASHTLQCRLDGPEYAEIEITQNCYDALESIRSLSTQAAIWLDCVCINQEDADEKVT